MHERETEREIYSLFMQRDIQKRQFQNSAFSLSLIFIFDLFFTWGILKKSNPRSPKKEEVKSEGRDFAKPIDKT
jgi:hypothetical protein